MSSDRKNPGFTLIEMLVALTIIVGILAMVYGSFAATTRSIDASGARLAATERVCFALRLMTRQIRCAYAPSPAQPPSPDSHPTGTGGDLGSMRDIPAVPSRTPPVLFRGDSRDPRGEILSFITSSGLGTGPDAPRGLFRVSYLYDRASTTLSISRQQQADSAIDRPNTRRPDLLLSNVAGIELKFHDGRQWQPRWDVAQRRELPRAVKLEIATSDEAGHPHSLGTIIPIVQETYPESKSTKRAVAAGQP